MSKVDSLKKLNKRMTGKEVNGETVCEVIDNMFQETSHVECCSVLYLKNSIQ